MINRRKFIRASVFTSFATIAADKILARNMETSIIGKPVVISTWEAGIQANKAAWEVLSQKGKAIDAVEKGVMATEASQNCCVGL
ncbi:MAG TPA: glycosylasparaginase, partial [Chitinophagaceae bacterium]|nr:glycosylasparaginase [Chitinophagaceae bacterium]